MDGKRGAGSPEILGPPVGYVDLLDHATTTKLKKELESGKSFQKSPIRPSSAGACTRELFFDLMQFTGKASYPIEAYEPELHRIFALGHSVESHVLKQFELIADMVEVRYRQQVLSFEFLKTADYSQWLEGSLDMVFWSPKWKCVADVKSKKDKFSQGFKSGWDEMAAKLASMGSVTRISDAAHWVEDLDAFLAELNDPFFSANFLQLNLYANSQFLIERGVNHGAIIQYNKNDSRLREIRFKPSRSIYEATVAKFQRAMDGVAQSQAPARDYVLGSVKCAFCKHKAHCWGGKDTKKAFYGTLPKKEWPVDTHKMGDTGRALEDLFVTYRGFKKSEEKLPSAEQAIVKALMEAEVEKVRLESGDIYELRRLKDSVVIRRGKL